MTAIEIIDRDDGSSRAQRWSHALTLFVAGLALLYGLNLRAGTINATTSYTNVQAGIRANYPQNWLVDEEGDYVVRVRDMTRIGFKTTITIAVRPVSPEMTETNVLNTLNITRPQTLAAYNPLSIEDTTLPDDSPAKAMTYTYVAGETNPFLESISVVVLGYDILTIKGGQAIVITFRADALTFDRDFAVFDRFLENLEF
jgi:hypothetical protein